MARDLERLKEVLWNQFEKAVERQPDYEDRGDSGSSTPSNFAVAGRQSIGTIAQAIVDVEREMRVKKFAEDQQKMEEEIANGTRRDVMIGKPLKIKP
ncbi:MAG: hypothetical protein ACAH83_03970 [Alphaproteobacteria bacterium]